MQPASSSRAGQTERKCTTLQFADLQFAVLQFSVNSFHRAADCQQASEQAGELVQRDHVGAVAGGGVGIGMRLEEQAVDAQGGGGPGQRLDHRPVAAGGRAQAARLLDAVGGVEDHRRAEGLHLGDGPHVVDQPAVAEERAPLAQQDVAAAARLQFADDVLHVPRRQELALLHVYRPAGRRRGQQQIGLPGEEGGDLQQVADLGHRRRLVRLVDVGGHRQAGRFLHAPQNGQPALQARARGTRRRWCGWPCRTRP